MLHVHGAQPLNRRCSRGRMLPGAAEHGRRGRDWEWQLELWGGVAEIGRGGRSFWGAAAAQG
uniref:Uncharacterized protein n=1 Tax=Arundo donax TaxID=35708 RepID=A0A0A9A3N6_ARUDO